MNGHMNLFPHGRVTRLAALALAALLAACATPPQDGSTLPSETSSLEQRAAPADIHVLRTLVADQDRLYKVAAPLLIENAPLCRSRARKLLGFVAKTRYSYSARLAPAAQELLGLDERLRVSAVLPGSAAAKAGIRAGDILVAAEGIAFPAGEHAEREAAELLAPLAAERDVLSLTVLRGRQTRELKVPLTTACAFNIEVGQADLVNAYGDGYRILVTRGMLRAVRNDRELAYVLAKEIAHNVLGHAARQNQGATMGGIIDNLARLEPDLSTLAGSSGLRPLRPEFDTAADRLSVYLLARAGYDVTGVAGFWRRLAQEYPASVPNGYTALHPQTARRLEAIEQAVQDAQARQADGRPLAPEL